MKKKLKLFTKLYSFCFALAVLCFGVYAASTVDYTVNGTVSYDIEDAFVKINTKIYASTKLLTKEQVQSYVGTFTTADPLNTENIILA